MITKEIAQTLRHREELWHKTKFNADGITPLNCRVNGKCKTWARYPAMFKLPVKRGLYEHGYIDEINGCEWQLAQWYVSPKEVTEQKRQEIYCDDNH